MAVDLEDIQFDELLQDKRHKEIKSLLQGLKSEMSKDKNASIVEAINRNTEAIGKFVDVIGKLKIDSPNVNVETNQESVINSLTSVGEQICNSVNELKALIPEEKKSVKIKEFKVIKNQHSGRIESVKPIYE
jgi:hypothetical protein